MNLFCNKMLIDEYSGTMLKKTDKQCMANPVCQQAGRMRKRQYHVFT